ncbi:MAG: PHP domain-containing protein [Candidatus Promineifilaceae bacterium]
MSQLNSPLDISRDEINEIKRRGAVTGEPGEPPPPLKMKVDLHCHTEASHDCITPLADIPQKCQAMDIHVQAITDHDQIWGAQKLQELVGADPGLGLTIIVGEEISTAEGEIIGLFLHDRIEPGLTAAETISQIRAQNGLVLLPHGFDPLKRFRLRPEIREQLAGEFDIIETFNARISRPRWNQAAVTWCVHHGTLMSAGSDAHRLVDIGAAWVELDRQPIHNPSTLLRALKGGIPTGNWTHPVQAFLLKTWEQLRTRLRNSL